MDYKTSGQVYKQDNMQIINDDCMNILKQTPDNYYDLCICDPPYGIGMSKNAGKSESYESKDWDSAIPKEEYFNELRRVSKNQLIWGGNYFTEFLPPVKSWFIWDKRCGVIPQRTFADCEMAWTNIDTPARIFRFIWDGMIQGDMKNKESRIHPTQKPVKLYNWIYANYADSGQKILDTHLGSGSNAIAAHYAKMHFVGCELDEDYYKASIERIRKETRQQEFNF